MKKVRLLSVEIKPNLIIDDGENLEPFQNNVETVPASEWPTYYSKFQKELKNLEDRLNENPSEI